MLITTGRVLKFSIQNLVRNAWLTVATVSVLALTLVSLNVLISVGVLGRVALSTVREKLDVSVHFKPGVEESRVQTAKVYLLALPEVKDVTYISPAEALAAFSESYKNDGQVLESLGEVGENPFGATLVVRARRLEDYPRVAQALNDPLYADLIESTDNEDRQAMIARVEAVAKRTEAFGLFVTAIFAGISLLIVFNTIRMSIFTRKEEIAIMRLVGASNGFIRMPFYVEAFLWSTLALAAAFAVLWPAARFTEPYLRDFFGSGSVDLVGFYAANAGLAVGGQLAIAALVAVLTTKVATAKYLKV